MIAELPASATLPTLPRQQQQRSRTNSDVEEEEIKDVKTDARDEKSSGGASSAGREDEDVVEVFAPPVAIPWKLKWFALFFTIALPLGQNWSGSAMSPLKATFRTELGINNTQYGIIDAAGSLVSTIWPVIGGLALDWYGYHVVTLLCTSIILVGTIVTALAPATGLWKMMVGGAILQSFGVAALDAAQHKLFYHWFGTGGLALAFGLETAVARATQLVSGTTTLPIRNSTGSYAWSLWVPVFLCAFSLAVNVTFVIWERTCVPKELRLTPARERVIVGQQRRWNLDALWLLPWVFWILPMTQLFQAEATGAFSGSATDLITKKGYKEEVAAFYANARSIIPILMAPVVGLGVDRFGHRFHLTAAAPLFFIIAFVVMGWTNVNPLAAVVIFSLGSVINYMPFQVIIPLLVRDQNKLGTAFGVWRAMNSSGTTILEVLFGIIQDRTPMTGIALDYKWVLVLGLSLKVLAFFLGLGYIYMDHRVLNGATTMSERARTEREAAVEDEATDPLTARPASRKVTIAGVALFGAMMFASWGMFIAYVV